MAGKFCFQSVGVCTLSKPCIHFLKFLESFHFIYNHRGADFGAGGGAGAAGAGGGQDMNGGQGVGGGAGAPGAGAGYPGGYSDQLYQQYGGGQAWGGQ